MKTTRAVWVWLHRYVGLAIAAFVTIAGLTGSVLAYIEPLREWLVPARYTATARGSVLGLDEIDDRIRSLDPQAGVIQWPLGRRPGQVAEVSVAGIDDPATGSPAALAFDTVHIDPVSGTVLGTSAGTDGVPVAADVLDFIYRLHYTLALPGESGQQWGVWIMGTAAILWFLDCFVGAWLTLPRGRPLLAKWRPAWGVKRRRLNFDLHRAGGLWFWGMLAILALSSVQQNLNQEVLMPVARLVLPLAPDPFAERPARSAVARQQAPAISPGKAETLALAEARRRGWRDTPERMHHDASSGLYRVVFTRPAAEWFTATRRELYLDDAGGALVHAFEPGHGRVGDSLLDWLSALHFGSVLGWPYKLLLCVTGLIIATLSVTGVVIWWRKRNARSTVRERLGPAMP